MKLILRFALMSLGAAGLSWGASCGTIAAPLTCSITVGGTNTFTVTGFNLINLSDPSDGPFYAAGDFNIDIATGGGLSLLMTFSKNVAGPTPGTVFAVNGSQFAGVGLQYSVTLSTLAAGTVAYTSPDIVALSTSSALNSGLATVQMILNPDGPSTSCQAVRNSATVTQGNCALPAGLGSLLEVNQIMSLSANGSNASIGSFTNLLSSSFTSGPAVPEPSSFALMGLGLIALKLIRKK